MALEDKEKTDTTDEDDLGIEGTVVMDTETDIVQGERSRWQWLMIKRGRQRRRTRRREQRRMTIRKLRTRNIVI